jgi:CBS domain containing-hemolysin-like protein
VSDAWLVVTAVVLVGVSGLLSAADAALVRFSSARAEELLDEKRVGARYLVAYTSDRPRHLNSALLLRVLCEVGAATVVALEVEKAVGGSFWATLGLSVAIMGVVSFVVIGVGPRTLGRQHNERIALLAALPITWLTRVLGPIPGLLILLGNALTPGKGFRQGPFNTETELRELVDLAEASNVIEDEERQMIHNVFELGDTTVREVMVPRGDVVYIERHKNLRQTMSLFLRSGFSRVPVVGDGLDDIVGMVYFKDVVRRDFEAPDVETVQRIDELMRPVVWVPESKPVDDLLTEMQKNRQHIAVVVDEYGGTAGLVTIEDVLEEIVGEITDEHDHEDREPQQLPDGSWRVPARFLVDDLEELGFEVEEDGVDSVGGLLAKHLGVVPIAGSSVEVQGLRFTAEQTAGRRNKIGTVLVTPLPVEHDETGDDGDR